jgi:membrane fusion protein (multidrug efflux system)
MPEAVEQLQQAGGSSSSSEPRKNSKAGIIFLIILVIAACAGAWYYYQFRDQVSTDDAQVDGHISAVAPKISGNVVEVLVKDNQSVKAGDVLVRIDSRDFQARVEQARAALLQAQSQLSSARVVIPLTHETTQSGATAAAAQLANAQAELERSRISHEQASGSELSYAQANIRAREAAYTRAQADLARMKPLAAKSEISQQQFDAYVAAERVAESELQAARERLASAQKEAAIRRAALDAGQSRVDQARAQLETSTANRKQVDIRKADAGSAEAAVAAARASLQAAELQLSYTTIVAPTDGVVTRKSVEVGQIVQPGQGLMAIVPLGLTWVTANFKETQLAHVQPGQKAEIHVDMYGRKVSGVVDSIASATGARMSLLPPENATGNFVKVVQRIPVKILVEDRQGLVLRPGMNADVTIFLK